MAHHQIRRSSLAVTLFQKMHALIGHLSRPVTDGSAIRFKDTQALEAFSRLSEDQLRDIGVCRKPRRRQWDLFDRTFSPGCKPVFDYFRVDG